MPVAKKIKKAEVSIETPVCGTEVITSGGRSTQTNPPVVSVPDNDEYMLDESNYDIAAWWTENADGNDPLTDTTMEGGKDYSFDVRLDEKIGYNLWKDTVITLKGAEKVKQGEVADFVYGKVTADHDWNEGTETKAATCTEKGEKVFVCKHNGEIWHSEGAAKTVDIDPLGHNWGAWKVTKQPTTTATGTKVRVCKNDATHKETQKLKKLTKKQALQKGASAKAAEQVITSMKGESDPAGSVYNKLQLKSSNQAKTSITLAWKKPSGTKKVVIYGNKCGKSNKMKKLGTYTGRSRKLTKVAGKKLKKGTYYKFIAVALDKNNCVVSTSKIAHVATKGGKVTNPKKVTVKKGKKAVSSVAVNAGKTVTIKNSVTKQNRKLKLKTHRAVKYESSNTKIATVTSKGKVKAITEGTAKIYCYAQNGAVKVVTVRVK